MTQYVISTMTNSVNYRIYKTVGDLPTPVKSVRIHGGTGLPSLRSGFGEMSRDEEGVPMWTADGIVTPVSDEDYEVLKDHWLFKKHLEGGYVKVLNRDITENHKEVKKQVATMERRDEFAQLTPATLGQKLKVTTGGSNKMEADTQFRI